MKLAYIGKASDLTLLQQCNEAIEWVIVDESNTSEFQSNCEALFNLTEHAIEMDYSSLKIPVFIHSVCEPLHPRHSSNVVRICAWNGFLQRSIWEVAGNMTDAHVSILKQLGKNFKLTADQPGFIAPRVIAMIINEAYFAKTEGVSSEEEIDIAMKLGTNYPKGPFEWKKEIGVEQILALLLKLSSTDTRYTPCDMLIREATL